MFIELLTDFLGHKPGARLDVFDADVAIIAAGKTKAVVGDPSRRPSARPWRRP
jgi:hypothetical protein